MGRQNFSNICITCIIIGGILASMHVANADSASLPTQLARQWVLFHTPYGVAVDPQGNVYVADYDNWAVKKICVNGSVQALADNIPEPNDVAVDSRGNVYVAGGGQYDNNSFYKVSPNGSSAILADNMIALSGVCTDAKDNAYITFCYRNSTNESDSANYSKFNCQVYEYGVDGSIRNLTYNLTNVVDVAVDHAGNVYVTDAGNYMTPGSIKKITAGYTRVDGYYDVPGIVKTIDDQSQDPWYLAIDPQDDLYVSDNSNAVKKIYPNGSSVVLSTAFNAPKGVAVDAAGAVYVADQGNNKVKKLYPNGTIVALGYPFNAPLDGVIDAQGNVYVADTDGNNGGVREIYANGSIVTRASGFGFGHPAGIVADAQGNIYASDYDYYAGGMVKKIAPSGAVTVLDSGFSYASGLDIDASGNLYVAEEGNGTIAKIAPDGTIRQAWSGFGNPWDMAVDASGNIYVANTMNYTVDKLYPNGTTVLYGGSHVNSTLALPYGVAVDKQGLVYVACNLLGAVKVIYPDGTITTLIDGLNQPTGVSINSRGHLLVTDMNAIGEYVVPSPPGPTSCTVSLHKGWNLISLPVLNDSLRASGIPASSGVDKVAVFNGNNQSFSIYRTGITGPGEDIPLVPDRGYFINCTQDITSLTFYGTSIDGPRSLTLYPGWNLVGWTPSYDSNAKAFGALNPGISRIARYNPGNASYNTYIAGMSRDDRVFNLGRGSGYFVYNNASTTISISL